MNRIAIPFRAINTDVVKANHNDLRHGMAHVSFLMAVMKLDVRDEWIKAAARAFV